MCSASDYEHLQPEPAPEPSPAALEAQAAAEALPGMTVAMANAAQERYERRAPVRVEGPGRRRRGDAFCSVCGHWHAPNVHPQLPPLFRQPM